MLFALSPLPSSPFVSSALSDSVCALAAMSKVLVLRVGLAGAAESLRAVIDCGFALQTCVREHGEVQMSAPLALTLSRAHCGRCRATAVQAEPLPSVALLSVVVCWLCVRFVYTFLHLHVCSAEDEEELEDRLHGIEERLGTRLIWHTA